MTEGIYEKLKMLSIGLDSDINFDFYAILFKRLELTELTIKTAPKGFFSQLVILGSVRKLKKVTIEQNCEFEPSDFDALATMTNLEDLYISIKPIKGDPLNGLRTFLNDHLTKTFKKLKKLSVNFKHSDGNVQPPNSFFENHEALEYIKLRSTSMTRATVNRIITNKIPDFIIDVEHISD